MAQFGKLTLTARGQALITKMMGGTTGVHFTKISTSSTDYSGYSDPQIEALTAVTNVKQTSLISNVIITNTNAIRVEAAFTNATLNATYSLKTLALYALDPDLGEILYAIASETSGGTTIPAYNGVTVTGIYVQLITVVGNAASVSLDVDPAAVATIGDVQLLQAEIDDLAGFVGYNDADIYGAEVDFQNKTFTRLAGAIDKLPGSGFDGIGAFGGRRRCNLTNGGVVTAYQGDAAFTTTGALTQAVTVGETTYPVGTVVQTMVEQPKFWYKVVPLKLEPMSDGRGYHLRKGRWYVSDYPKSGFKLHPAFIKDGIIQDKIYLAAFEPSLYDVSASAYVLDDAQIADFTASTGDMLSSIANAKPMSGLTQDLTRAKSRILAANRGPGWSQGYAATASLTQMLMLVEFDYFNMQTKIGVGNVNKTDDGATSMTELTGATVTLGNETGAVTNTNNINNINIVSYRGEENFWGNIWAWVDGMNYYIDAGAVAGDHGRIYVADHGFTDNTADAPYQDTGIGPLFGEGYVSAFAYNEAFDWLFVGSEYSGNSALPVGDRNYATQTGWRVAMLGGRWNGGLGAGPFDWYWSTSSSYRYRIIGGGRLVYAPNAAA